jgi:hypothetical protein
MQPEEPRAGEQPLTPGQIVFFVLAFALLALLLMFWEVGR